MAKQQGLAAKSRSAFAWYYSGAVSRLALSFGTNILLARLLGPVPFGQMAFVLVLVSIGNLFANVGVPSALIQKTSLTESDAGSGHTIQVLVGIGVAVAVWMLSPWIAAFFGQPGLVILFRAASPLFILQTLGSTSAALLQRAHDARRLQVFSVVSYAVGYLGVGVPMAFLGKGVWSLIAAQLVQATINSALLYLKVRHSIVLKLARDSASLLSFGLKVLAANLCNWGISNLDNAFVGKFAGAYQLGLYSRAFSLAQTPQETVSSSLQQVLLPSMSQVEQDARTMSSAHAGLFGLVLLALGPPFAAMAAAPDVVIRGLYGLKWIAAVPYFRPLALAIPIHAAMAIAGPLLVARGRPQLETVCQAATFVLAVPVYYFAVSRSVLVLSWAVLAVYIVRCLLLTWMVLRESGGRWRVLALVSWPAGLMSGAAAVVAFFLRDVTLKLNLEAPVRLLVVACGTGGVILAVGIPSASALLRPIVRVLPQILSVFPQRIRDRVIAE